MKVAPRYSQIISYYQSLIESGKLVEGEQMPTEEATEPEVHIHGGEAAAETAKAVVGRPFEFGGSGPDFCRHDLRGQRHCS